VLGDKVRFAEATGQEAAKCATATLHQFGAVPCPANVESFPPSPVIVPAPLLIVPPASRVNGDRGSTKVAYMDVAVNARLAKTPIKPVFIAPLSVAQSSATKD